MKYIKITWMRVVISLFGGGAISETIHILTGNPNRPMASNLSLLYALVVYLGLTFIVKKSERTI